MKLVFATRNRHKLSELIAMVRPAGIEVVSLDEVHGGEVAEDAPTFSGNAEKKARAAQLASRMAALADDSGLEVDALDGAPGVHSARYAGDGHDDEANNRKLVASLQGIPNGKCTARFRCALAFVDEGGSLTVKEGVCEGSIALEARGKNGFGYDPFFVVKGDGRTMAELSADEKNRMSHRARAMEEMLPVLSAWARGSANS